MILLHSFTSKKLIIIGALTVTLAIFFLMVEAPEDRQSELKVQKDKGIENLRNDSAQSTQKKSPSPSKTQNTPSFLAEDLSEIENKPYKPSSSGYLPEDYRLKDGSLLSEELYEEVEVPVKWLKSCENLPPKRRFEDLTKQAKSVGFSSRRAFPGDVNLSQWHGFYELRGLYYQFSIVVIPQSRPKRYSVRLFKSDDENFETGVEDVTSTLGGIASTTVNRVDVERYAKALLEKAKNEGGTLGSRTMTQTMGSGKEKRMAIYLNAVPIRYYYQDIYCQYEGVDNTVCSCYLGTGDN